MKRASVERSVVFSTDSFLGRYGLGGPAGAIARALPGRFPDPLTLARGTDTGDGGPGSVRTMPVSAWRRALQGTRLARFVQRSQEAERIAFARWCARTIPPCRAFLGENSTSLECLQARAREGRASALLFHNLPFRGFREDLLRERAAWGGPDPLVTEVLVARTESEAALADTVIVMSALVQGSLEDAGVPGRKIRRARMGVDSTRFTPAQAPAGQFVVAYIGWLELRKGFPYLVEAFRDASLPDSLLLLHGGTGIEHHHRLVDRLAGNSNVRIVHGPVEETLARASVVVLPSVSDGYGMAALEAMSCGIPVVVTDRCGVAEDVRESGGGLVVPARSSGSLREAIRRLHADPDARRTMGKEGRRFAVARPWGDFAADVLDVVGELPAQSGSGRGPGPRTAN